MSERKIPQKTVQICDRCGTEAIFDTFQPGSALESWGVIKEQDRYGNWTTIELCPGCMRPIIALAREKVQARHG